MLKIGIRKLAYEKTHVVYKAVFSAATQQAPKLYHPVAVGPHGETGSHTALPSSSCEMRLKTRETAKTGGNQRYALPCRGCQGVNAAVNEVCAAARAAHTPPA